MSGDDERQHDRRRLGAALAEAIAGLTLHERNLLGLQQSGVLDRDLIGEIYRVKRRVVDAWIAALQAKLVDGTREALRPPAASAPDPRCTRRSA